MQMAFPNVPEGHLLFLSILVSGLTTSVFYVILIKWNNYP